MVSIKCFSGDYTITNQKPNVNHFFICVWDWD